MSGKGERLEQERVQPADSPRVSEGDAQGGGQTQRQGEQREDEEKQQEEESGIPGGAQQEQQCQKQGGPIGNSSVQHGGGLTGWQGAGPL